MYELRTEITIDASSARVWKVLMQFDAYPEWNGFVREIEGKPDVGSRLRVVLVQGNSKGMTIKPTVVACEPGRRFAWFGRLLIPKLFDGTHVFELEAIAEDRCKLVHREEFAGVLIPLLRGMLDTTTRAAFERMNRDLARRVEATTTTQGLAASDGIDANDAING